ncbi:Predicted nucleic acid-binding protein, contains PIN domain [Aquiflexum balticum DSM 16537]|uniref:Predicted nucleic acid-binding protein, contains PIN domain n=1 Tax=Aquiflexum balticum DSM 16537 TaxID=758820 RepID=A0A1W2H3R1_9BACT|nr:PIN domain-containing protein [Aquiflexum balticum]SMD43268.1 Predicted nucleic acid-binding protein, contains PIN domain [Aquiflexum balticum DSM 16537]
MRIVVDTNILFSAMLNTNSRIARILLQPKTNLNFYSTEQLLFELENHSEKLKTISGYDDGDYKRIFTLFTRRIRFINVQLIKKQNFLSALSLTEDLDIDDTEFVALTEHIKGKFWSGDRVLKRGLEEKGWTKLITTEEILKILKIK